MQIRNLLKSKRPICYLVFVWPLSSAVFVGYELLLHRHNDKCSSRKQLLSVRNYYRFFGEDNGSTFEIFCKSRRKRRMESCSQKGKDLEIPKVEEVIHLELIIEK